MTNTNIPRLRFRGFNGEWKKSKLSDIGIIFGGLTGKTKEDFGHGNSSYLTYLNVNRKFVSDIECTELVDVGDDEKQNKIQRNDVLFTISSETPEEVGLSSTWIDDCSAYLNSFSFGYRFKNETDGYYTAALFRSKTARKKIFPLAQGISRYNLSKSNFLKLTFDFAEFPEQKKIGSFFAKIDKIIELQTEKLEQLKKLKKGYLQKMFPQDGESVPRLRFSGFSGDWKDDILDNLLNECENDQAINPEEYKSLKVSLHFKGVQATNDHPRSTSKGRKYYVRRPGELIIGKQNFHNGGFAIIPDDINGYVASSAIVSFINKSNCDLKWINYYMMNSDWLRRTTVFIGGTGQKEYSIKTLKSLKIKVPSLGEQQKISEFLSNLDQMIDDQFDKIDKLKQQKKAYLQKMFI